MAFLLLHVINQQLKLRNNLLFSCSPHQRIDVGVIVVHPTHILVHPRLHRAHRLKSAGIASIQQISCEKLCNISVRDVQSMQLK